MREDTACVESRVVGFARGVGPKYPQTFVNFGVVAWFLIRIVTNLGVSVGDCLVVIVCIHITVITAAVT